MRQGRAGAEAANRVKRTATADRTRSRRPKAAGQGPAQTLMTTCQRHRAERSNPRMNWPLMRAEYIINPGKPMVIVTTNWARYNKFVNLCCVPTIPYSRGPCWVVEPNIAFIGYDWPVLNNSVRPKAISGFPHNDKRAAMLFINKNVRVLSRIMVKPEFRGRGIASNLIIQTLPLVGVPYIECVSFAESIKHILLLAGFTAFGLTARGTVEYFLWERDKPHK
jgi:GNAT superfamily N-acetyltransferase